MVNVPLTSLGGQKSPVFVARQDVIFIGLSFPVLDHEALGIGLGFGGLIDIDNPIDNIVHEYRIFMSTVPEISCACKL